MATTVGIGVASAVPLMDYLDPLVNRPDLFEDRSVIVKEIHGPSGGRKLSHGHHQALITLVTIMISAILFITVVSWCDVLRSWFDAMYINPIIYNQMTARLLYATTITIIGAVLFVILAAIWYYWLR